MLKRTNSISKKKSLSFVILVTAVASLISFMSPSNCRNEVLNLQTLIETAGAAPKTLSLTRGNWTISSNLEVPRNIKLTLKDGATMTVAAGKVLKVHGVFEAPPAKIFSGTGEVIFDSGHVQRVYPQWWGARGDGKADDTFAFQSAINSFAEKGGEIQVSDGTYVLDEVGIKSNIAMRGTGTHAILKQKSGARYCITTNPDSAGVRSAAFERHYISFSNLTFLGTVAGDGFSEFFMLLDIRGSSNIYVSKCSFIGFRGDGIFLDVTGASGQERHNSKVTITGCTFDGVNKNNRNGISVIDCDGLLIDKCSFKNCSRPDMPGAIDIEPDYKYNIVRNIKISQNRFDNIGGNNIIQFSVTFKLGKLDNAMQNIEISKNSIEGDGKVNGIYVGQPQLADDKTPPNNILISDNVVRNTNRSFMIFGFKDIRMINNIFEDCKNAPCISYSEKDINVRNMQVIGNTFKNLSQEDGAGIAIFGVYKLQFQDNIFDNLGKADGTSGNALFFRRQGGPADYVTIKDNTFRGNRTKAAVQSENGNITYPEHNLISGNTFLNDSKVFLPAQSK